MTKIASEFQIARLELQRGDVLVVRGPAPTGLQHETLSRLLPGGVKVLYLPPDIELSVLTKAEIEARIKCDIPTPTKEASATQQGSS